MPFRNWTDIGAGKMIRVCLVIAIIAWSAVSAFAQEPQQFTFTFSPAMANVIIKALNAAPYGEAAPVIDEMRKQAAAQIKVAPSQTGPKK